MSLPTLETLATLAAAMARKYDTPKDSAERAIDLWEACELGLHRAEHKAKVKEEEFSQMIDTFTDQNAFLSQCMGTPLDCSTPIEGRKVPLNSVLVALMPVSKDHTRDARWIDYRRYCMTFIDLANKLPESSVVAAVEAQVAHEKKQGLLETELLQLRADFATFLESFEKVEQAKKSDKGVRARKIRPITRKFLAGTELTEEEQSVIKSLTNEEIEAEILKTAMKPAQKKKWKAAIVDFNTPAKGRPRKKKTAVEKKVVGSKQSGRRLG